MLLCNSLQLVVVNLLGFARDAVVGDFVTDAGKIHRMAVRQMAAVRKVHAQNLIAILNRGEVDGHVCLRAAVWLHVGVLSAKQFLGAIDRRLLHHVSPFAAAVVTLLRIAFSILVGEDRAGGFEHGFADEVFARDQLQAVCLARDFVIDGFRNQGINFGERCVS